MAGRLDGKTVIISGAASGQGRSAATLFAEQGARLALCDINEAGLHDTVGALKQQDGDPLCARVDVSDVGAVEKFVDGVIGRYDVIDVVYNNAGIVHTGPIGDTSETDWDRVHAVNVKSAYFMTRAALPALRRSGGGSVLNVSSAAGMLGIGPGTTLYASSKGALISLTRAQAVELAADGIRVNCIVPGAVDTPMPEVFMAQFPEEVRAEYRKATAARTMLGRFGEAAEIARVALFLATDDASYITGLIMPVDAGWTAW